ALVVVALVVEHEVDDRRLVTRLAPQGLRSGKTEAAVPDRRHHGLIRPRKLYAEAGRHAPSEHVRAGTEKFLAGAAERHRCLDLPARIGIGDIAGVAIERCFELNPDAFHAHGAAVRVLLENFPTELTHFFRV